MSSPPAHVQRPMSVQQGVLGKEDLTASHAAACLALSKGLRWCLMPVGQPCMFAAGELQPGHAGARCGGAVRASAQRRPGAVRTRARGGGGPVPAHAAC